MKKHLTIVVEVSNDGFHCHFDCEWLDVAIVRCRLFGALQNSANRHEAQPWRHKTCRQEAVDG
jgi:hypothetical protein